MGDPTSCPACGTVLLSAAGHICPGARQAAEDLGAAMPATPDQAAAALGDPVADLDAARAMIDDARPRLPRPVFAPPVRPLPSDYSPDPPSRPASRPTAREHLGDAGAAIALAELETRLEAATTARAWGDRLGELAAEVPAGVTVALRITDTDAADLYAAINAELAAAANSYPLHLTAQREAVTGTVTLELRRVP